MPIPPHGLGGRLPLLDPRGLTAAQKRTYDTISSTMVPWAQSSGFKAANDDGTLVGPFNSILWSPEITDAFLALQEAEQEHTALTDRVRQVVILAVGAVWQCDYERYAHGAVARKAGLPEDAIRALASGAPAPGLSDEEQLARPPGGRRPLRPGRGRLRPPGHRRPALPGRLLRHDLVAAEHVQGPRTRLMRHCAAGRPARPG